MSEPLAEHPTDWRKFFDAHAPRYMENTFTRHTAAEVGMLMQLFGLPAGSRILDMGCGTGRHAIEFARHGFRVTGVDFSEGMLAQARAASSGLDIEWICADATAWRSEEPFDAAVCLCEGGVGLLGERDDPEVHDRAILENIAASLKPGAPFVMTALNGYQIIRQMKDEHVQAGAFDPATMIAHYKDDWELPEGRTTFRIRERLFIPPEMVRMMRDAGFQVVHVWGGTAGEWGARPLKLDEIEAMYVGIRL